MGYAVVAIDFVVSGRCADWVVCLCRGRRPGVAPAGEVLFFASPKKSTQKKGDPQSATPSRCEGANLRRGGCGVRRRTHFALARSVQTTAASQFTKHGRFDAHATPQPPRRRRSQQGVNTQTAIRVFAALDPACAVPCARRLRPQQRAERSNGPNGCLAAPPLCMRRGAQRPADKGSRLSERSEFERDPAGREHRRLPEAKRRDADSGVALSLVTFFRRSERKLLRCRAHSPAPALCKGTWPLSATRAPNTG